MTRILLVEDSPTQALALSHTLESEGWHVDVVESPEQALEYLSQGKPDLLITDYYLPGMKGNELIRLVRLNSATRSLPIMMLTVADPKQAELMGLESGADDYLEKTVSGEILLLRVRTLLRRNPKSAVERGALNRRAAILVVEDSPTFQAFLVHELGSEGYQVVAASSGEEALQLCERSDFDAVLVDLVLPGMDGIEVCKRLETRRRDNDECFAIIILTSRESSEDMTLGLEAGADDFLNKSSDLTVVKARIRGLVRRKRFQEENARISRELQQRELETMEAKAETRARTEFARELEEANRELELANQELGRQQAQLVQSEKMASLGQLVAGIAHEINNPLAFVLTNIHNISGWLKGMSPQVEPNLDEQWRKKWAKTEKRLDDVKVGLERVRDLVLRLRTFSRLDEGEFKFVDIHESLDSVLTLLGHRVRSSGVTLTCHYEFEPSVLGCFPGQLNQVAMNLVTNAIDAVEGGGEVRVGTRQENGDFVLTVSDNGGGIPENIRERVFDPFFTTKPVGMGTGLGMSISFGIVEAHEGSIEFDSEPGKGTEFRVRIPLDLEKRLNEEKP